MQSNIQNYKMQEAKKSIEWFMECTREKSAEISDNKRFCQFNRQISTKRMDVIMRHVTKWKI